MTCTIGFSSRLSEEAETSSQMSIMKPAGRLSTQETMEEHNKR